MKLVNIQWDVDSARCLLEEHLTEQQIPHEKIEEILADYDALREIDAGPYMYNGMSFEDPELPDEVNVPDDVVAEATDQEGRIDWDIITNWLSDKFGYCILDYNVPWFDKEEFLGTMILTPFCRQLLDNMIDYIMNEFDDNKCLASALASIIPNTTEEEILAFCTK